jgi:hypothetical protein
MKINYFNPEHVHALIDLPTNKSIEEVVQLFKGSSSHWINENRLLRGRFSWGRGYGSFSVSHSHADQVAAYIANQEEHHRKKTLLRSLRYWSRSMGWNGSNIETVETVFDFFQPVITWLKPGANEIPNQHSKKQAIVGLQFMARQHLVLRHAGIDFVGPSGNASTKLFVIN